jgi:hypothetical protein
MNHVNSQGEDAMSEQSIPTFRFVRSFTSIFAVSDLETAKQIYHDEFLPALAGGPRPYTCDALIEIVQEGAETVEAVIHTQWESLDALHEAMAIDQVGTALMRMLLLNKERPKVATYEIDCADIPAPR